MKLRGASFSDSSGGLQRLEVTLTQSQAEAESSQQQGEADDDPEEGHLLG